MSELGVRPNRNCFVLSPVRPVYFCRRWGERLIAALHGENPEHFKQSNKVNKAMNNAESFLTDDHIHTVYLAHVYVKPEDRWRR